MLGCGEKEQFPSLFKFFIFFLLYKVPKKNMRTNTFLNKGWSLEVEAHWGAWGGSSVGYNRVKPQMHLLWLSSDRTHPARELWTVRKSPDSNTIISYIIPAFFPWHWLHLYSILVKDLNKFRPQPPLCDKYWLKYYRLTIQNGWEKHSLRFPVRDFPKVWQCEKVFYLKAAE